MGFKNHLNVYEFEYELPGSGEKVKFKPITTAQIKKMLVHESEQNPIVIENVFDELITSCVVSKDFDIKNLYLQDRYSLLMEIRKMSKGSKYEFTFKCPECKSDNLSSINFDDFKMVKRDKKIDHKVKVSDTVSLLINHIKRGDQIVAFSKIGKKLKSNEIRSEMAFKSLALSIDGIETPDGIETELTFDDKEYIINQMSLNVFEDIREWYKKNDFGLDMTYKIKCQHCEFESENEEKFEISSNFF
jgi:predicted Zn-ribbon and HTH transcriptional regulator